MDHAENGFVNKAIIQQTRADREGGQMNIMSIFSGSHLRLILPLTSHRSTHNIFPKGPWPSFFWDNILQWVIFCLTEQS